MTKRTPAPSDAPKEGPVPVETISRHLMVVLEKQGLGVIIVGFLMGIVTGWVPCRVCDQYMAREHIIVSQESDRKQVVTAVAKIAEAMEAQTASIRRMDTRDAIYTCARIPDKDARVACIEVAVTRK